MRAGKTTLGFAGASVIGGMNTAYGKDSGFATVGPKNDNSFLNQTRMTYGGSFGGDEMMGTDEHSQKVQRLLEKVRRMVQSNNNTQVGFQTAGQKKVSYAGVDPNSYNPNDTSYQSQYPNNRRIGPFSFDIDDEIDTEILTSDEVYKDLKELESILDKDKDKITVTSRQFGRAKKKTSKRMF